MAKERHTVAFVVGAAIGGIIGAVYGLFNAPRPGETTRAELSERWHDVEERTAQEIAHIEDEVRDRIPSEWAPGGDIRIMRESPASRGRHRRLTVLPIGDENAGTLIKPYVNFTLIGICVLVFLYEVFLPEAQFERLIFQYGAIPDEITHGQNLVSLLTSMFLHGGWWHLIGNMLFLYVFGDNIEDAMGHISYLLFYLLCGILAALAQVLLDPNSTIPLVGASGAISGVMGAYIVLFPHGRIRTLVFFGYFGQLILVPAWVMIGIWFALQIFGGFAALGSEGGGVAFWAHVGGLIAGAVLVWLFRDRDAVARQNAVRETHNAWERIPGGTRGLRPGSRREPR